MNGPLVNQAAPFFVLEILLKQPEGFVQNGTH